MLCLTYRNEAATVRLSRRAQRMIKLKQHNQEALFSKRSKVNQRSTILPRVCAWLRILQKVGRELLTTIGNQTII